MRRKAQACTARSALEGCPPEGDLAMTTIWLKTFTCRFVSQLHDMQRKVCAQG